MNCGTTHHEGCPCHEARRNAEIERLRDGIARHRDATVKAMSQDWELWALLEENHDER